MEDLVENFQRLATEKVIIFEGHKGYVNKIIQLDKYKIATCSDDTSIRIWDLRTRKCSVFLTHEKEVYDLSYPQQDILLSASNDNTARIWYNYDDSKIIMGKNEPVRFILLKSDIIMITWDTFFVLRKSGEHDVFKSHTEYINTVIKYNTDRYVSCSRDGSIKIWREDGAITSLVEHKGNVLGVIRLKNEDLLSWGEDKKLIVWREVKNRQWQNKVINNNINVQYAIELTSGVIVCISGSNIVIIDKGILRGHKADVNKIIELGGGNIASCSMDGTIRIWPTHVNDKGENKIVFKNDRNIIDMIELEDKRIAFCGERNLVGVVTV
jgi:WD40 repeat protein